MQWVKDKLLETIVPNIDTIKSADDPKDNIEKERDGGVNITKKKGKKRGDFKKKVT